MIFSLYYNASLFEKQDFHLFAFCDIACHLLLLRTDAAASYFSPVNFISGIGKKFFFMLCYSLECKSKESWENTMIDVEKVRRWIVNFSCLHPMASLPFPQMLVYEQEGADYLIPLYDVKSLPPESGGQLTLTIGGCGQLIAGGEKYDLRPGNAFLYRHRDDGVRYFTAKDSEEPWRFIWISFGGVSADRLIAEINAR